MFQTNNVINMQVDYSSCKSESLVYTAVNCGLKILFTYMGNKN
jgi:hypothetical protein